MKSSNSDFLITLRSPRVGDIGCIIYRHAMLYAEEYGWNEQFEALVAQAAAAFLKQHDPERERAWIAEQNEEFAGCVFIVQDHELPNTARLRLLIVEPKARGLGIGRLLVQTCIDFAKQAGYDKMILWTNDALIAARSLYESFGFELVKEEPIELFGPLGKAQTWERIL
jgi:GNAT superfamily N-acetyltransferase